jgi:hypothetical protein
MAGDFEHRLRAQLESEWAIPVGVRSGNRGAVPGALLNKGLRQLLTPAGVRFEATVSDGVIWASNAPGSRVEGFDSAQYDEQLNLASLWELCLGRRRLADGERVWEANAEPAELAREVRAALDIDGRHAFEKQRPTVLGELQFGNWGLLYRDLMRLLAADEQIGIDLFVYITATGRLSTALSSHTVNFEMSKHDGLLSFSNLLRVPTWLIGLDLPPDFWDRDRIPM